MCQRRDKCKCGRIIVWKANYGEKVICKHCGAKYKVEQDYEPVTWLEEQIEKVQPYKTYPR